MLCDELCALLYIYIYTLLYIYIGTAKEITAQLDHIHSRHLKHPRAQGVRIINNNLNNFNDMYHASPDPGALMYTNISNTGTSTRVRDSYIGTTSNEISHHNTNNTSAALVGAPVGTSGGTGNLILDNFNNSLDLQRRIGETENGAISTPKVTQSARDDTLTSTDVHVNSVHDRPESTYLPESGLEGLDMYCHLETR